MEDITMAKSVIVLSDIQDIVIKMFPSYYCLYWEEQLIYTALFQM